MRIALAVPWRSTPDRLLSYQVTRHKWDKLLPNVERIEVDSGHVPFNLAACRNRAVERLSHCDVVVCADADTSVDASALYDAVDAASDGRVHLPYTRYVAQREDGAYAVVPGAVSGVLVMAPTAWWAVGGQDESFKGWGFEDVAFYRAAELCGLPLVRHAGTAVAMWHPFAGRPESAEYKAGVQRYQRYLSAQSVADLAALRVS